MWSPGFSCSLSILLDKTPISPSLAADVRLEKEEERDRQGRNEEDNGACFLSSFPSFRIPLSPLDKACQPCGGRGWISVSPLLHLNRWTRIGEVKFNQDLDRIHYQAALKKSPKNGKVYPIFSFIYIYISFFFSKITNFSRKLSNNLEMSKY